MQTLFCTDCGHKMTYSGAKPKFCSSCGVPMGSKTVVEPTAARKSRRRKIPSFREQMEGKEGEDNQYEGDDEGDDEGTDIDHVPDIRDLQYTISHDGVGNKTYNLSELLDVSSEEEKVTPKPKARRGRPRKKQS